MEDLDKRAAERTARRRRIEAGLGTPENHALEQEEMDRLLDPARLDEMKKRHRDYMRWYERYEGAPPPLRSA